jgi:manganese-dependent ADP-ribose/CDP-alcohol diphosphatase
MADCQYADAPTPAKSRRLYRRSPIKLRDAVDHFNLMPDLDAILHLGDAIDRDEPSYHVVTPIFATSRHRLLHVMGNHDFDIAHQRKIAVPKLLGMPAPYYAFQIRQWRLLLLNGCALSEFASSPQSPSWLEAKAYAKQKKRPLASYNGGLGPVQRQWLDDQLTSARTFSQRVVIACHYPLHPIGAHSLWDAEETDAILQAHPGVVKAWLNGHDHLGNYASQHGIHFINLRGMVETETNAYARLELTATSLHLTGFGREPSRELPCPAPPRRPERA